MKKVQKDTNTDISLLSLTLAKLKYYHLIATTILQTNKYIALFVKVFIYVFKIFRLVSMLTGGTFILAFSFTSGDIVYSLNLLLDYKDLILTKLSEFIQSFITNPPVPKSTVNIPTDNVLNRDMYKIPISDFNLYFDEFNDDDPFYKNPKFWIYGVGVLFFIGISVYFYGDIIDYFKSFKPDNPGTPKKPFSSPTTSGTMSDYFKEPLDSSSSSSSSSTVKASDSISRSLSGSSDSSNASTSSKNPWGEVKSSADTSSWVSKKGKARLLNSFKQGITSEEEKFLPSPLQNKSTVNTCSGNSFFNDFKKDK